MNVESLTLAIATVDRSPEYIHKTLASLFAADPLVHRLTCVHLMVGTSNASYLDDYRHHAGLSIRPVDSSEHSIVQEWDIRRRYCHNYHRCLSLNVVDGGGICICEDDIVFRDSFLERLIDTVDEIEHADIVDYGLALTSAYDFEDDPSLYCGARFCKYGYGFYGTQCMYFPKGSMCRLREYIFEHGVQTYTQPVDLLIKALYGERMYACPRALANHIGSVSTGLGGAASSPSFFREYACLTPESWGAG